MSCWLSFIPFLLLYVDIIVLSDDCGQRTAPTQLMISHGNQSRLGEWPWHTAVLHRKNRTFASYACGGTIISSRHILTAAHCTYSVNQRLQPSKILVLVGISHLHKSKNSQQMAVAQITTHEDHSDVGECDIALLKLERELEFTSYVKPICLWRNRVDEELIVDKFGYVPGWGKDERGRLSSQLQHAAMQIVSRNKCKNSDPDYYTRYLFDRKSFCAGFRNGTSPGLGDSGGGLYIEMGGKWILRGIVSNGKFNSLTQQLDTSSYIVFTDVARFVQWVDNHTDVITSIEYYSTCGKKKEVQFFRRGFKEERMWPWQGDVYRYIRNATWLCQTAVINENYVLSPADVFSEVEVRDPSRILAVFKSYQNGKDPVLQHLKILKIIRHPRFDRSSSKHGVALLKLKKPLMFSELIKPICLWKANPERNIHSSSTGYTGEYQVHLYDKYSCVKRFNIDRSIAENHQLCFDMSLHGEIQTPALLYVKHVEVWYLRGISLKIGSRRNSSVVPILDLAYYNDWIEKTADVVESQNLLNLYKCQNANYSWLHQIWSRHTFQCYASLITPGLLLTTASCVDSIPIAYLSIKRNDLSEDTAVNRIHLHPSFNETQLTDNVAVIELKSTLDSTPICLPKIFAPPSNFKMKILHWDSTQRNSISFKSKAIARSEVSSCAEGYSRKKVIVLTDGQHICGQIEDTESDMSFDCVSNLSGASLFYTSDDAKSVFLRGLLDVGRIDHCDSSSLPEVFIDMRLYADWLRAFALVTTTADETFRPENDDDWIRETKRLKVNFKLADIR